MNPTEKTVVIGARFPKSEIEKIRETTGMNYTEFVRQAVVEKMASLGVEITAEVGKRGGSHGGGRPVGSQDKKPRKRRAS